MKYSLFYETWKVDAEYWADMTKVRGKDKTLSCGQKWQEPVQRTWVLNTEHTQPVPEIRDDGVWFILQQLEHSVNKKICRLIKTLYSTVQYNSTLQYTTVKYRTVQYSTVQYWFVVSWYTNI